MSYFTRRKRNSSVFKVLTNRQIYGPNVLQDVRIIKNMINMSDTTDRKFKYSFKINSKSPIVYQGDRLFLNAFTSCLDLTNQKWKSTAPRTVYSLPRCPTKQKIETMLVYECPLDQKTFCKVQGTFYSNGPYSVGLTADNYLKVFDCTTGKSLKQVYLFPGRKFKYLSWESDLERLVVQSTLSPQTPTLHVMQRVPRQTDQVLLYIGIFTITPLEFKCLLPISYKTFGTDILNASIENGMLIVMYRRRKLQFFSLENILKNQTIPLRLGDRLHPGNKLCLPEIDEFTNGIIGVSPLGLPVNVHLLEKPCVLFEVNSSDDVSLGGYPWHYISNIDYLFYVKSVKDHSLVENGILKCDEDVTFGTEKAFFHPDLSGRILYIAPSYLRYLKLGSTSSHTGNTTCKLQEQFTLDYRPPSIVLNNVETKSGRKVKQLYNRDKIYMEMEIIQDFDYDDELDLLVVLYLDITKTGQGIVGFYDNQTGQQIYTLTIDGIDEQHEHSIAINRNLLVLISKQFHEFRCLVYHLA